MSRLYLRGNTWHASFYRNGREYRFSCRTTSREQAEGKLKIELAKSAIGVYINPTAVTLESLIRDLTVDYAARGLPQMAKKTKSMWANHLSPFFHNPKVVNLATSDFNAYKLKRLEQKAAPGTINRELQVLIAAFKLAEQSEPAKVLRRPRIALMRLNNARKVFVTDAQREKLFAAASREGLWARIVLELAYLLGWRRGELFSLKVGSVDLVDRVIRLETSKNGEAREVPLTERIALLLQQITSGRPSDDSLFPVKYHDWRWVWQRIRKAAGCPQIWLHDFRRTSARSKRAAGVPEGVIMDIQGWKTAQMFRRYAIVNNDDKRKALELIDAAN